MKKLMSSSTASGILMITPAVVCLLGLFGYPIVRSFLLSFQNSNLANNFSTAFIGFGNFRYLFVESNFFVISLKVSAIYTVVAVCIELILGFIVAVTVFAETRWSRLLRSLYLVPMVMAPVAAGLLWRYMYQPDFGILDYILKVTGIVSNTNPIIFLGWTKTALPSLLVVEIWQNTPFVIIVFAAGLSALPQEPYDAAYVDGASGWQLIRYITLPMLRPIFLVILVIRSMDAFRAFDLVYVMTRGGPALHTETATFYTWINAFRYFNMGQSAAAAYIITLIVLLMSIAYIYTFRSDRQ